MNTKYHFVARLIALMSAFMLIVVTLIGFSLSHSRDIMLEERKALIKSIVETATSLVADYHRRAQMGELTENDAKEKAKKAVRAMRYGKDGYLFIYNTNGITEAHALYPELEKKYRMETKDAHGVAYIRNQIDMALAGGGFTYYHYRKPGDGKDVYPKMVYDSLFRPWNWVIVTGVYIDDIDEIARKEMWRWGMIVLPPFVMFLMMAFYLGRMITKPIAQLEKARHTAETATRAKSDFLANMSHEIRTPLNGSMGMLALLLGTKLTLQQREWVQIAYQSSEELLNLINDILDISKVEAGQMTLENFPFDLQANIKAVTDLIYPRTRRKNVEMLVAFQADLPRMMVGDPVRLRQILMNLVGNAAKFTMQGYIMISVEGEDRGGVYLLKIEVRDTGPGIPDDKQTYIFEKFSQAEESTTRNYGGTGLGLAICRKLTALMGGEVGVRSVLGDGSTFWFTVVLKKNDEATTLIEPQPVNLMTRVLVAQTNEMAGQLLSNYLRQWGYRVDTVKDAAGVTSLLQQGMALDDPFRFLLMDIDQWGSDAVAIKSKIDALVNMSPGIRVILVMAPDKLLPIEDIEIYENIGVLTKPVFPQDLQDIIHLLSRARAAGEIPRFVFMREDTQSQRDNKQAPTQEGGHGTINVLIAEDQRVNQILMKTLMKQFGCDADVAYNGIEAVKMSAEKNYDIIFMDGHMPEMDGLEATRQIRAFEISLNRHTPIIAITADAMKGDRDKCIAAGMDDYLHKPVKAEQIKVMIDKYTRRSQLLSAADPSLTS